MQSSLDATAALTDQKAKIEQYRAALQHVIRSASVEDAKVFVDHSTCSCEHRCSRPPPLPAVQQCLTLPCMPCAVLSDAVPLVISRQLLSAFAQDVSQLPADTHKPIAE